MVSSDSLAQWMIILNKSLLLKIFTTREREKQERKLKGYSIMVFKDIKS